MDAQVKIYLWTAIVVALIAVMIVQMWPRRRVQEIVTRRKIATRPERVWDAYVHDADNPVSTAFNDTVVSVSMVDADPETLEVVMDASDRHGTHHAAFRIEVLASDRPRHYATKYLQMDGDAFVDTSGSIEELHVAEEPEGVAATLTWRGVTTSRGQHRTMLRRHKQYMDSLKAFCETGQGTSTPQTKRSPWRSLGLTVLAIASFAFLFGWSFAIVLTLAIVVHEFGHWLAMRMTGQPKPRVMLVPFLGGVAVPNHPFKTQFDQAFVALAGPGISLLPCLALLWAAMALGVPEVAKLAKANAIGAPPSNGAGVLTIVYLVALLNGLQLLPVLPLDGGHVIRSVINSASVRRVRPILLGLAVTGLIGFLWLGDYILAAILALGAMQAWHAGATRPTARAMGTTGLAVIIVAYAAILGIYAGIVVHASRMLNIQFL